MSEVIDDLIGNVRTDFGYSDFLQGYPNTVFGAISSIHQPILRMKTLQALFEQGNSIAWLTGIVRAIGRDHVDMGTPEDSLLSSEEWQEVRGLFLRRLESTPPSELLTVPYFLNTMYAWHQIGEPEQALSWLQRQTEGDENYIDVLENMTSWSSSSEYGVRYRLRADTLKTFFGGVSSAEARLLEIEQSEDLKKSLRDRAKGFREGIDRSYPKS